MTLTPDIIQSAYRESNLIAIGATPSTAQTAEALKRLQVLVSGVYGSEVGDPLLDWPLGNDGVVAANTWTENEWKYPVANARLIIATDVAQSVYFPVDPDDGARITLIDPSGLLSPESRLTVYGNGRTIQGAASQEVNTANASQSWFYRGDLGNWVLLSELTGAADEEFPFPQEFDDYFITRLAMRLNPRYGRAMNEASVVELDRVLGRLRARYRQRVEMPCDPGVLALSDGPGRTGMPGTRVTRGRIGWMQ